MTSRSTRPLLVFLVLALLLTLLALIPESAGARPPELPLPASPGRTAGILDGARSAAPGLAGAAAQDTTWFGGTVWAADSSRWEAVSGGVWTFDSGVGSSFDHGLPFVNPYKDPALHAVMEGWIGIDRTYSEVRFFRRLTAADFTADGVLPCVGYLGGLEGQASLWCGVLPHEADSLCYAAGMGYGNNWFVCVEHAFTYDGSGTVELGFDYRAAVEDSYDYAEVLVDTTGAGAAADVEVASYTGSVNGHGAFTLVPGADLRSGPGPYTLKFCVDSDAAYSDEDGLYPTACGAFAVDRVSVQGGGVSYAADFETGDDGWTLSPAAPGPGGTGRTSGTWPSCPRSPTPAAAPASPTRCWSSSIPARADTGPTRRTWSPRPGSTSREPGWPAPRGRCWSTRAGSIYPSPTSCSTWSRSSGIRPSARKPGAR